MGRGAVVMLTPYVLPLGAVGAGDVAAVGGKGANLGELVRAGFAVPAGFVVTTRLYRDAVGAAVAGATATGAAATGAAATGAAATGAAAPEPATMAAVVRDLVLDPELVAPVVAAYAGLGEGPVAVRSSATAEDLPGAAFAGQQETTLDVVGPQAVLDAVRACWASLWSERAVAYRRRVGHLDAPEMAVVVQRMVPSEHAGVLFTADPVTGARDVVVIEASPGLGEAVVGGTVTPEHVVVERRGRVVRRPGRAGSDVGGHAGGRVREEHQDAQPGLRTQVLTDLASTGRAVAAHFACPQDVEWAYADQTMWLVQARALTALPPAPLRTTALQRAAAATSVELLPTRPYPLDLSAWTVPGWFSILARMAAETVGVRIDVARMFPSVDGVLPEVRPPQPRPTWRTFVAPLRLWSRLGRFDPARWTADPRFAAYEDRVRELQARDLVTSTWPELLTVPAEVLDTLDRFVDLRVNHLGAAGVAVARLKVLLTLLGASAELWPLLSGQATRTRAANQALDDVADLVRRRPDWREVFRTSSDEELVAAVWHTEPYGPLRGALRAWLDGYGHRETTSAALVSAPTWADEPGLLLGSLRALVERPSTTTDGTEHDEAELALRRVRRRRLARLTRSDARLRRAADAARAALVFREDTHFHALRVRPPLRSALLEAGERLTRADVLTRADEVFHLELADLRSVRDPRHLDDDERARLRELVRRRSARRAELGSSPLISPATLRPGGLRPGADALVTGAACGGGQATGPVRLVRGPAEFGLLQAGEVLVCPATNPAWTPLFTLAAAVVADTGSFGSHAAIVAREYGIPAVMGTGNGTSVLSDGQVVLVDGNRGAVTADPRERGAG